MAPDGEQGSRGRTGEEENNETAAGKAAGHAVLPSSGSKMVSNQAPDEGEGSQVIDFIGEPSRNRTWNLLIKSQLLCQLS